MWKKESAKWLWFFVGAGFFLVPLSNERIFSFLPLYPLDIVGAGIILGALAFFPHKKDPLKGGTSLDLESWLVLGLFLLGATISFLAGAPNLTGLGQLKSWFFLPAFAAFLFALALQGQRDRDRKFLTVLLLGMLVLLAVVTPQFLLGERTFDNRFQGPFTSPNFLAYFLAPSILLFGYFFRQARASGEKTFFAVLVLFSLLFLFSTHSFGGWLVAFGSTFWYAYRFLVPLKKGAWIALASLVFFGAFFTLESLTSHKLETIFNERSSFTSRLTIWTVAMEAVKEQPLFGMGVGRFQEVYLAYQPKYPPYLEWAVPQPHNLFLAVWLQAGLVGMLAFLFLLWRGFSLTSCKRLTEERAVLESLLFGSLLYGLFDTPLFGNGLSFFFWMVLAILLFPQKENPQEPCGPANEKIS